jgi:hypothetical protein
LEICHISKLFFDGIRLRVTPDYADGTFEIEAVLEPLETWVCLFDPGNKDFISQGLHTVYYAQMKPIGMELRDEW